MKRVALRTWIVLAIVAAFFVVPLGRPDTEITLPSSLHSMPKGFLWGASTAGHQVEGGLQDDWTNWENGHAEAQAARSGLPASNYISGSADDSYNRYAEDIALAKSLNLNAYRFSIEWSRIEPTKGKVDQVALDHYAQEIATMKATWIEPVVTLWHYALPTWVAAEGGWANPATTDLYLSYVQTVVSALKDNVHYWITINEPDVYALYSYLLGGYPPGRHNPFVYIAVTNRLITAHNRAYAIIKKIEPNAQVSLAKNDDAFTVSYKTAANLILAKVERWWWNDYIEKQVVAHEDFIGLNYYLHQPVNIFGKPKPVHSTSDVGWELYPQGLAQVLEELRHYNRPVIITEDGLADVADTKRAQYIRDSIAAIEVAQDHGTNVQGYLHWSLLDNFEWSKGFTPEFGLIHVDRTTQKRTVRPSAKAYANLITQLSQP